MVRWPQAGWLGRNTKGEGGGWLGAMAAAVSASRRVCAEIGSCFRLLPGEILTVHKRGL